MTLRPRTPSRLPAALALGAVLALAPSGPVAAAGEPDVLFPAKVTTLQGRIHEFPSLGHELEAGSFVFFDGETEGRVAWRDLDRVIFVGNIRHRPGADGPKMSKTRRVTLRYLDGSERTVNLVIGKVHGHDGASTRYVSPQDVTLIDFDEVRIAPAAYRACERGHAWEQLDYIFCPYDGTRLTEVPLR